MLKRKKPEFARKDWHKKIKLGKGVKKNKKWRAVKGRHNKIRLSRRGHSVRPKIGWSSGEKRENIILINNLEELGRVAKGKRIIIGKVGLKKRKEILSKAKEMKIEVLNKYFKKKDEA
jgi:large subunit ribosomal protein L32e